MRTYAYLRASTQEQDASRAQEELKAFAEENNQKVSHWFFENESGATLKRPELFRLLSIAEAGDILLVEQVDRISRLNAEDWSELRSIITTKQIKVVSLDLPTSHAMLNAQSSCEFTDRMFSAINAMMLDMLAAIARKDYEDRRRRQAQGIAKAKSNGKYKGRSIDHDKHSAIQKLLIAGNSYSEIEKIIGCSRPTIAKVKKLMKANQCLI